MTSPSPVSGPQPLTKEERAQRTSYALGVLAGRHGARSGEAVEDLLRYEATVAALEAERDDARKWAEQAEHSRAVNASLLDRALQEKAEARSTSSVPETAPEADKALLDRTYSMRHDLSGETLTLTGRALLSTFAKYEPSPSQPRCDCMTVAFDGTHVDYCPFRPSQPTTQGEAP